MRLIKARNWVAAELVCTRLTAQHPEWAPGWRLASEVALGAGRPLDALAHIDEAIKLSPRDSPSWVQRARCFLALGKFDDARQSAANAQTHAPADPVVWDSIGGVFNMANDYERALSAYDKAVELAPNHAHFLFNRAAVRRFLGQLTAAETDYDRVIALKPDDHEAYKNRADLRVQTRERNHTRELEDLLAKPIANWPGEVQLRYALAKEYEDLGEYQLAFQHLERGARLRRAHLSYDVANDVATVGWIMAAFPSAPPTPSPATSHESPIFIVGLPRSGTTLVDRILGSHSGLASAGELNDFAMALVDAVRRRTGETRIPREALVAGSAALDFAELGRDYLRRARNAGITAARFTDKMPLNYLYCGLIRRALPHAKIVHVTRDPMAVCYAMYKMLFQGGYPFSYDLGDIASYYVAYRRLMAHWSATLPGAIYEIRYENLVADLAGETRKLLEYCDLPWEDACTQFHLNPTATTTASASQVRRELYDSSVAQWRHYERWLMPLRASLEAAGLIHTPQQGSR